MNTILYLLVTYFIFHSLHQATKYILVSKYIKESFFKYDKSVSYSKFIILAPMLHEESNVENFLNDLNKVKYPKNQFQVKVVTTEKELVDSTGENTITILENLLQKGGFNYDIEHIHYPDLDGYKADQLSFAFNQIKKQLNSEDLTKTFFLTLDTDSKTDPDILNLYNSVITNDVDIYQQPLLWFKNIDVIKNKLMQSFAFTQTFFSISYEIPMFIGKFYPYRIKYFVGHGLCLRGSYLNQINGYPKIIEDVRIGRISSYLNKKVKLVPGFGIVETAKSASVYFKQSSVWFFGCGLFLSDYKLAKSIDPNIGRFRSLLLTMYGFMKFNRWLNKGTFHLIGIILSFILNTHILTVLFIFSLALNSSLPVCLVYKDFKYYLEGKFEDHKKLQKIFRESLITSALMYLINFIGLYYGLIKLLKYYLWGSIKLQKTER